MTRWPTALDATRALIAGKTCLALVLGLGIGLWLDWHLSYMGIVIVVLQTAALGSTLTKGLLYIAGTLTGALMGLAMVGLLAHDRRLFVLGMTVLTGLGVYAMLGSRRRYAWMIFLITSVLVGWLSAQNTPNAFETAVMRASTICLAVAVTVLVHAVLWPIRAGKAFERQLPEVLDGCRDLVARARRNLAGEPSDPGAATADETAMGKAIDRLGASLAAAAGDTNRFKRFQAGYQELIDQLYGLLLAILTLHEAVGTCLRHSGATAGATDTGNLPAALKTLEGDIDQLKDDLARPRDGTRPPPSTRVFPAPDPGDIGLAPVALAAMLLDTTNRLASRVAQVGGMISKVEDPGHTPTPLPTPPSEGFRFKSVRFRTAATAGLATLTVTSLFILVNWPHGLQLSMIFVAVAVLLSAMDPLLVIERKILLSLLIGPAIAAIFYFGIMRTTSQYAQLAPWLVVVFFPLLYLMSSPNPRTSLLTMASAIFAITLLSLNEEQSYSFASFINNWIGLCGGFGVTMLVLGLLSTLAARREFFSQVHSFFAWCGESMRDTRSGRRDFGEAAAGIRANRRRWRAFRKQLQMWAGAINYNRTLRIDRQATRRLIESMEHAALHLAVAEQARGEYFDGSAEHSPPALDHLYDACAESFQRIEQSLADRRPAPDPADVERPIRDLESKVRTEGSAALSASELGLAAHFQSLARAIGDCRDSVNAIDWEACNRNRF